MKLTSTNSSTSARLIIESEDNSYGGVHFGDPNDEDVGRIRYYHGGSYPNSMRFYTAADEKVRIDGSGNVMINQTTALAKLTVAATWSQAPISCDTTSSNASAAQINFRFNNTAVGNIVSTSSGTSYNESSSDRTLKKNFENWTEEVLPIFKNLNPQKFNFINEDDGTEKTKGYIAQDLAAHFPRAYPKNDDDKYMFNPSGMVVYLMKALQEEIGQREALEARISKLEMGT